MPAKKTKRRASGRLARIGNAKVTVIRHSRPAPDRHGPTKMALACTVFVVALAIGFVAFYDAGYYATGYAVIAEAPHFIVTAADASGGTASSTNFKLDVSMGEATVGKGTSASFSLTLGAMAYLSGDSTPPACTIKQSTGTPAEGATVTLTASCSDDTELKEIALYTDESGTMLKITDYGSPAAVSGAKANTTFLWQNAAIEEGTTVAWKAVATDTSGNEGESTSLAFTVGAAADTAKPTASKPVASPTSPQEGGTVTIISQLSDNMALASADLLVNGNVVDTAAVEGKTATATLKWMAGKAGTYAIKVSATDAAGNTAESSELVLTVVAGGCAGDRPADILGDCTEGFQSKTTYICDPSTRTWKPLAIEEPCEAPASPVAFIAVGVVALAVAAGAAVYILKVKKPAAKKAVPEAPATFG
ncbi:MAG: hypothetical protein QXD77_00855 [Candidatus Aenigmatarchaeota archaeon]